MSSPSPELLAAVSFKPMSANITTAFKEWEVVCDALTTGKQHLIFRKGGIHEGREGFSFKHETFALFPTRFHAQAEHVTVGNVETKPDWEIDEDVTITHIAKAQWAKTLTSWDEVKQLSDYHIYSEQTLHDRFHWEGKGMPTGSIHVALVRVYELPNPLSFSYAKSHAGCRSWIDAPEYSTANISSVITDQAFIKINKTISDLST